MSWQAYAQLKPGQGSSIEYRKSHGGHIGSRIQPTRSNGIIDHQRNRLYQQRYQQRNPPLTPGRLLLNATIETFCGCYSTSSPRRSRPTIPTDPQRMTRLGASQKPRSISTGDFSKTRIFQEMQPIERQRQLRRCSPLSKKIIKKQLPPLNENEPVTPLSPTTTLTSARTGVPLPHLTHL